VQLILHIFLFFYSVQETNSSEQTGGLKNITLLSNLAAKRRNQLSWYAFPYGLLVYN